MTFEAGDKPPDACYAIDYMAATWIVISATGAPGNRGAGEG